MKKALQGFWRGGLLGGLLGLLGGEVFAIGLLLYEFIPSVISEGSIGPGGELIFFVLQMFIVLPGLLFGCAIGGLIGIFLKLLNLSKTWHRLVGSVFSATLLHLLIAEILFFDDIFKFFAYKGLPNMNKVWVFIIWPIYLIAAILFGYHFPTFKPRWPKFFRKKQLQTE